VVQAATAAGRATIRAAQFASPHLATAGRWLGAVAAAAARQLGALTWKGRRLLLGLAVRAAWWAALLMGVQTCLRVIDTSTRIDVDGSMQSLAIGIASCAAVTALASDRRLRWAGIALGTALGAALLLLHSL
jgi:hypothetical protein